jgi:hypothetical protein
MSRRTIACCLLAAAMSSITITIAAADTNSAPATLAVAVR